MVKLLGNGKNSCKLYSESCECLLNLKKFKEFIIISTGAQLEYVKIEDVKVTYGRNATLPCPYFEKTSNVSVSLLQCLNRYHYVFKLSIYRFHSNIKDIRTHNELKLNSTSILRSQINYCTKNRLWN